MVGARTSRATFRRRRLGVVLGAVVVAIMAGQAGAALGSASLAAPGRAPSNAAVTRYVVQPGDSLWGAAEQLAPNDDPARSGRRTGSGARQRAAHAR